MLDLNKLDEIYDKAVYNDDKEVLITTDMLLDIIVEIKESRKPLSSKFETKYKNQYCNLGRK